MSGEKRRTGGWARWKIPLLSPPRPQRRAFIRGYPPGGPDSILRPPLCHQRMERWRFVRPPLPSLLPRTAAMCEQRPGSSAAVPEGGGFARRWTPPRVKQHPAVPALRPGGAAGRRDAECDAHESVCPSCHRVPPVAPQPRVSRWHRVPGPPPLPRSAARSPPLIPPPPAANPADPIGGCRSLLAPGALML